MSILTLDKGLLERSEQVDNALASVRLEGLEPSEEAKAILQRFALGELTVEEMGAAVDAYVDRKYGPVRLPRHDRP